MEAPTPVQLRALRRGRLEVAILARGEGLPAYDLDGLHVSELRTSRVAGVAVADSHPFAVQGDGLRRQVCAVTTHDASPAARAMVRALEEEVTPSV